MVGWGEAARFLICFLNCRILLRVARGSPSFLVLRTGRLVGELSDMFPVFL
jgi:hypothetical protein